MTHCHCSPSHLWDENQVGAGWGWTTTLTQLREILFYHTGWHLHGWRLSSLTSRPPRLQQWNPASQHEHSLHKIYGFGTWQLLWSKVSSFQFIDTAATKKKKLGQRVIKQKNPLLVDSRGVTWRFENVEECLSCFTPSRCGSEVTDCRKHMTWIKIGHNDWQQF